MDGLSGASNWRPHSDVMRSAKERVAGEPLPGVYHESGGWYTSNRGQLRMDGLQTVTASLGVLVERMVECSGSADRITCK